MAKHTPVKRGRGAKVIKPDPVTAEESRRITLREMFQREFKPEYHQILRRCSDATQGLYWGSPPGSAV